MEDINLARLLRGKIASLTIFQDLAPEHRDAICSELGWLSLPGGWRLFDEGERGDSMYILLSGRLAVIASVAGGGARMVAQVLPGETVGEMALISGEARSAQVEALRDSELLKISRDAFDRLVDSSPGAMRFLNRMLVARLRNTTRRPASDEAPRTIAIQPIGSGVDARAFAESLARALQATTYKTATVTIDDEARGPEWRSRLEEANDFVIYVGDRADSQWSGTCLRQADRVLALIHSDHDAHAAERATIDTILSARRHGDIELVILHPPDAKSAVAGSDILARYPRMEFAHVRNGNSGDLARVARLIAGRAVGIVLSGGGARGFAHLGVLAALRDSGVQIDLYAGASMGSIIAATAALEWDLEQALGHLVPAFVESNPLGDYTIPVIALARGRRVSRRLREHFGDRLIEECWRTVLCTSSDLTSGNVRVHRRGLLWKALRASVAIPGVLTPVVEDGHILVDSGVLNNMPIDLMLGLRRGPVIAVDVMRDHTLAAQTAGPENLGLLKLLRPGRHGMPNIVALLMRAGTVGSEAQVKSLRPFVDLLIEPRIESIGMLDWKQYRRAIDEGYRQTMAIMEQRNNAKLVS